LVFFKKNKIKIKILEIDQKMMMKFNFERTNSFKKVTSTKSILPECMEKGEGEEVFIFILQLDSVYIFTI
jgi:hypothetical protein